MDCRMDSIPSAPSSRGRSDVSASCEQLWKHLLENTELVSPGVFHDPEVEASTLLMIVADSAERFEALHFGFNVVGLDVEVHPTLGNLLVGRVLEQDADVGVGHV